MSRKKESPKCLDCSFYLNRTETRKGYKYCRDCFESSHRSNKRYSNKRDNELKWKSKSWEDKGKKSMKITHFYYDLARQKVYLVSSTNDLFTNNRQLPAKTTCDYPKKDSSYPAYLKMEDYTSYIMFPVFHLKTVAYPKEVREQIESYIAYAEANGTVSDMDPAICFG